MIQGAPAETPRSEPRSLGGGRFVMTADRTASAENDDVWALIEAQCPDGHTHNVLVSQRVAQRYKGEGVPRLTRCPSSELPDEEDDT